MEIISAWEANLYGELETKIDELNLGVNSMHVRLKLDWPGSRKHYGNESQLMHTQIKHLQAPQYVDLTSK